MMKKLMGRCCLAGSVLASLSQPAVGQGGVTGGPREILSIGFANGIPKELSLTSGLVVVEKDGVRMLRASAESEFRVRLPEDLPEKFTLEFDLISKEEGPTNDLSFRGTNNASDNFAEVNWSPMYHSVVGGALSSSSGPFTMTTEKLGETVAGQLAKILASFEGDQLKLYTNGLRLYTVTRRFARTRVLRVSLGGQSEENAVYLARLRVAEGAAATTTVAASPDAGATPSTLTAITTIAQPTASIIPAQAQPTAGITSPAKTSEVTRVGTTTALAPPTALMAAGTPAMATLTWQAPVGWIPTGYTVVRNTVGTSESVLLTSSAIRATHYDDRSGFTTGKTYAYVITALSTDPKAFGTAETQFLPPPPQNVSNVAAKVQGSDVTLSWTGVPGASRYFIASSVAALAREVPATETMTTYSGVAPGSYSWAVGARYEPGPIETPASSWPRIKIELLAPRTITQAALSTAGGFAALGSRVMTLTALDAVGGFPRLAPRTLTLTSLIAAGASAVVAPPTITLSGLSATGGFGGLAPRVLTLSGLTATSGFVSLSARTITLPGLSAAGFPPVP